MELRLTTSDARALGFTEQEDDMPAELGLTSWREMFSGWLQNPDHVPASVETSVQGDTLVLRGPSRDVRRSCDDARHMLDARRREVASSGAEFLAAELRHAQRTARQATASLDAFLSEHPAPAAGSAEDIERRRLSRDLSNHGVMLQELGERLQQEMAARGRGLDADSVCRDVVCEE